MMSRWFGTSALVTVVLIVVPGCMMGAAIPGGGADDAGDGDAELVSEVAAKATDVAGRIGGADGFGGDAMTGYLEHAPSQMGFHGHGDLATATGGMMVRLHNESEEDCTFHLSYIASHIGLDEEMMDVEVGAGQEVAVDLPCSEMVGTGPLDRPGEAGCHLADGEAVDNTMAVPGFLGLDYECRAVYECVLTPDVDDLDGDGNTEELIIVSDAMQTHMMDGGPTGHLHGDGPDMMGPHMME